MKNVENIGKIKFSHLMKMFLTTSLFANSQILMAVSEDHSHRISPKSEIKIWKVRVETDLR